MPIAAMLPPDGPFRPSESACGRPSRLLPGCGRGGDADPSLVRLHGAGGSTGSNGAGAREERVDAHDLSTGLDWADAEALQPVQDDLAGQPGALGRAGDAVRDLGLTEYANRPVSSLAKHLNRRKARF